MAQQAALLSRDYGQLASVNQTLKRQSAAEKLARTPSVQERVRTNDSVVMILAKVYAITKKEQETNAAYRKEQTSVMEKSNSSLIKTIKTTNATLKKSIDGLVKISQQNLEENKTLREEQKLFEEEKVQETEKLEQKRHEELIEALKGMGKKDDEEKKKKKGGIFDKLFGFLLGTEKLIAKIFPGFGKLTGVIRDLFSLGESIFKAGKFILPLAKDIVTLVTRNPVLLAALGASYAVGKLDEITEQNKSDKEKRISDELEKINEMAKSYAEKGDVEGLRRLQEQREELKGKQAIIDITSGRGIEESKSTKIAEENKTFVRDKLEAAAKTGSAAAKQQLESMGSSGAGSKVPVQPSAQKYYQEGGGTSIRDVIGASEGAKTGYNATFGFGSGRQDPRIEQMFGTGKKLTDLSINEVLQYTRARGENQGAVGRYQFMPTTLRDLVSKASGYGIHFESKFTPQVQDKLYDIFSQKNVAVLKKAGVPITPENIHLAHSVGAGDAIKLIKNKDQNANVMQVLGLKGAAAKTNPHLNKSIAAYRMELAAKYSGVGGTTLASSAPSDMPMLASAESLGTQSFPTSGEQQEEKKPTLFGKIAQDMQSQLDMIKSFASGEGASDMINVIEGTKGMFSNMAEMTPPPNISPAVAALTDAQKTNTSLSGTGGAITVNNINQQQLAKGGGGTSSAVPPANVHDVANPSVVAALYGMHNVRPSIG